VFIAEFRSDAATDHLVRVIELVQAWRRFPWPDQSLPEELLPAGWRGAKAALLFQGRHRRLTGPAPKE
jgi:phenylacetic acid degradation operon negative regulatory protein